MPDLTSSEVSKQLAAVDLVPQGDDDLAEITHRINAFHEALKALDLPGLDSIEPVTTFDEGEEEE